MDETTAATVTKTESVWDYPRPPRIEPVQAHLQVVFAGVVIADSIRGYRVLETSHPPTYYLPAEDVIAAHIRPTHGQSLCEFKGLAFYWNVKVGDRIAEHAAWSYPEPSRAFRTLAHYLAFYPGRMDACFVDGEQVEAQPGDYYGGWITADIRGPFKGGPDTAAW
ncbi:MULTISPECIES: DUF427 domain-containing protein [Oleiagrimonas]|jgi:uncharacterized protein (DUF427 family)|uniref:DUF427 domain-containing protein n=1 Tax=Oleiagrimonas citrea TaxID=1665687 RepID=A0A846ZNV7_9GAMM|nr:MULTISPECIES: DUF427 domain-containing protein [Oleiagrimonas]NKZ39884.1 DUF427 domain-containing protein [Oleiagrimonas citrea]RAP56926.1 hypothetical protein BTJ49_12370 [Oleiagrimonas sp. MCCC 1A03011]